MAKFESNLLTLPRISLSDSLLVSALNNLIEFSCNFLYNPIISSSAKKLKAVLNNPGNSSANVAVASFNPSSTINPIVLKNFLIPSKICNPPGPAAVNRSKNASFNLCKSIGKAVLGFVVIN